MPQETHVVCCYSCNMFQVHIVKKTKKWQCKICNEKQSIQRVYFQGSASDCRINVQSLNASKGHLTHQELNRFKGSPNTTGFVSDNNSHSSSDVAEKPNKWKKYLCTSPASVGCTDIATETVPKEKQVFGAAALADIPSDISALGIHSTHKSIFETDEDFDITLDF